MARLSFKMTDRNPISWRGRVYPGLILLALLLVACGSRSTPPPSAIVLTAAPTRTAFPTLTLTPSPGLFTAIHAQVTYVPTKTPTPIPSLTATFRPTLAPATPAAGPEGYHLKPWSEQAALAAISEGEGILNSYEFESWSSTYDVGDFRDYVFTIERETARRFSDQSVAMTIAWKLAYQEALSSLSIVHFTRALENALNSGLVQPEMLNQWLPQYGFEVMAQHTVEELVRPGEAAMVLQVVVDEAFIPSSLFVVVGAQPGAYKVISIDTQWLADWRNSRTLTITDRNGNGRPEISIFDEYWLSGSPGGCGSSITLLEWQGKDLEGRFINLAQKVAPLAISSIEGTCERPLEFGPADAAGVQAITMVSRRFLGLGCPDFEYRITYIWSGQFYEWAEASTPPITNSSLCGVLWAEQADGLNEDALSLLEAGLENWPAEIDNLWGPSAQDYFRFRLGTLYALHGETNLAQATLESVRDHPVNVQHTIVSQLAAAYLGWYQNGQNPIRACWAANQTLTAAQLKLRPNGLNDERDYFWEAWGFAAPYRFSYQPYNLCDAKAAFYRIQFDFVPHNQDDIIQQFQALDLPVWAVERGDLNQDGLEDWLALAQVSGYGGWELWAFVREDDHLKPVFIKCCNRTEESFFTTLTQIHIDSNPVAANRFTLGDTVIVFQITQTPTGLKALLIPLPVTPPPPPPPSQAEKIKQIEQVVFESDRTTDVIPALQSLLAEDLIEPPVYYGPEGLERVRPYLLYLLGLAHELSGHEPEAVQAYWQLWHDYPDNPYTLMARRKLEEITP